jgi:hypothetical protein
VSKPFVLLFVSCACALGQAPDWRSAIQAKLLSQYTLTKATADRSTIITAGTVIVLKKDDLRLLSLDHRYALGNTYANGVIKQSFLTKTTPDGAARTFVAGEKLWLTRILFEAKGDGVQLEFLSDPFDDARYWGTLKFPFAKGSPPNPDEFANTVAQVMKPDDAAPAAAVAPAPPAPEPPAPPPVVQAPPLPLPPPPPPPDQPPPTIGLGQTKEQVVANFGQPNRIANLGVKQILYYKDFKVTLTGGKVTDIVDVK